MEATLKRAAQRVHESEDDKLLVGQAQSGDREAFEQLVRRHDRDILRLAFHMLGNREEAQEVFQETFLKAYRSLGRFRFDSSFYTWIYRIATNVGLDHLRKRQALKGEISFESDTEMNPDRPALKDTLAATTYYSNPERRLYGKEIGRKIQIRPPGTHGSLHGMPERLRIRAEYTLGSGGRCLRMGFPGGSSRRIPAVSGR